MLLKVFIRRDMDFRCPEEGSHPPVVGVVPTTGGPPAFTSAAIPGRSSSLSLGVHSGGSRPLPEGISIRWQVYLRA
jgi:hypothetical protein